MTLPSLHLRLHVQHSFHECGGVEPDLQDTLSNEPLNTVIGTDELLPACDEQYEIDRVSEVHDMQFPSTESLVEVPLNSPTTTVHAKHDIPHLGSDNHTPLSPPPCKSADALKTDEIDLRHDSVDSSPTSLRQLDHDSLHARRSVDEEPSDTDIQECKARLEETGDPEMESHPQSESCDKPSFQSIPPSTIPSENVTESGNQQDAEIRTEEDSPTSSTNTCDEIVESVVPGPNSHAEGAETCPTSGSKLDVTVTEQRRSPSKDLGSNDCEIGSSKTEPPCQSRNDDGIIDEGELPTDKASNGMSRDRDTSPITFGQPDISETRIAHSHSTPTFKTPKSTANSIHFDKGGLARTRSGFARVQTNLGCGGEVMIPERDACVGVAQGIEPRVSPEKGNEVSLSKSSDYLDIPGTSGTIPSACKMQCDSGEEIEKTNVSLADDDLATDINRVDADHQDASMDSSSTSLRQLEPPKPSLAHSTPALGSVDSVCSSSDLDRVENSEKITGSPHEVKRTYSSSVDTRVEEDIETLTTTSIQHTIFSVTNSDASHRTSSSLLTSSNESVAQQQQFVKSISNDFDIERDPLSASSADAEGAWREDHNFPRPHSRVKRMYSSSDSSPDSVPDHEECIEISDSVTEALANNHWDAYVSECRRCSSAFERRELEGLSKSGRLPHTGFTSSESMASMGSLPIQSAEAIPLLRGNSSRSVRQSRASEGRARGGMKSAFVKKAARLLSFVFGKNRSGKHHPESQPRVKKRSLSSLLCGRSS